MNEQKITTWLLASTAALVMVGFIIWLFIRPAAPASESGENMPAQTTPSESSNYQPNPVTPTVSQTPAVPTLPDVVQQFNILFDKLSVRSVQFSRTSSDDIFALYSEDVAAYQSLFPDQTDLSIGVALLDLNGDGIDEAMVRVDMPGYCGTAGCPIDIYRREGNAWTLVFSSLVGEVVGISSTRTNEYAELYLAQGNAVYQYVWTDGTYAPWALTAQWDGSQFVIVQ